jgi:peptide-methionine (R)-S-oxide reductase
MKIYKRKFLRLIGLSIFSAFLPINYLLASAKKIINPNLSNQQKNVMFNEGTERPYSSELLNEKRKGFYHCANCGNKLFASNSKFDSGTGWPSFSEALPGAFKTKTDYSFGWSELNITVLNVELITDMFLMMDRENQGKDFVVMDYV